MKRTERSARRKAMDKTFGDGASNTQIKKEINRKKRELVRNVPHLIAMAILIIVVMMTFADFQMSSICTVSFAIKTLVFIVLSYLMYYTEKLLGRRNGQLDRTYLEAKKRHSEMCASVILYNAKRSLSDFCAWWCVWERNKARKRALSGGAVTDEEWQRYEPLGKLAGLVVLRKKKLKKLLAKEKISEEEYNLICDLKKVTGEKRLAIVRACLIEKKELSPTDIIYESVSKDSRDQTPINIRKKDHRNDLISLVPLTIMMIGVLAFIPEPTGVNLGLKTLMYGLMRVVSLLVTGFRGNLNGETIYTVDSVENFKIQCDFLDMYEAWKNEPECNEEDTVCT